MWQEAGETFESASDAKGDDIQKLSVIQSLPNLLAADAQSCVFEVLPKIQQSLPTASIEFHIAASAAFKTILEQKLVPHTIFTQIFLQIILTSLNNKNFEVPHPFYILISVISSYWLKTLLDVIELLLVDAVKNEILPVSINKGQLSQTVRSRVMCCKLLGKICTRLDSITIKKEVLPTVLSLCQDVNNEVRACICSQLCFVADGLGVESTKQLLLPSLVDLASDEDIFVKKNSIPTIVALLPQLQHDTITGIIVPLVKKICDNALKSDDDLICVVAEEIGKLAHGTEKYLTEDEKSWFIKHYQQLAKMGCPSMNKDEPSTQDFLCPGSSNPNVFIRYIECRRYCAVNIPPMLIFASKTTEGANILLPTLTDLAGDPHYLVRETIGSCIHEISEIMKSRSGLIKAELIKLLNDDSQEVLQGLVPNLAQALQNLMQNQTNSPGYDSNSMPICKALLKCENEIATTNWRLSAMMWAQLEILPKYLSSDVIYKFFVPVAINRILKARPLPVRLAAGRTLLIFLRYNLKAQQRTEIRGRMYKDIANSNNCYVRMLYLRMMEEAMTIFSSQYMKEHFYDSILNMQKDRVANIRLKLASMLPILKKYLRLPADKKLLTTLESTVRNMTREEQDRDVINVLRNILKEEETELSHDGQIISDKTAKMDVEDKKKYEEEIKLTSTNNGKGIEQQLGSTGLPKKHPPAPKLSTISAKTFEDLSASKPTRQGSLHYASSGSSTSSIPKENPITGHLDKSKPTGIRPPTSLRYDTSKASASSIDLTTNWTRHTSYSMHLNHPWEPLRYPSTETTTNITSATNNVTMTDAFYRDSLSKIGSPCYTPAFIFAPINEPKPSHSRFDNYSGLFSASALPLTSTTTPTTTSMTITTTPSTMSTSSPESRRDIMHNLYNPYWGFSSMPEIPATLLDEEFIVDAGISIPQLASSQSASKIPSSKLEYQNHASSILIGSSYSTACRNSLKQRTSDENKTGVNNFIEYGENVIRHVQTKPDLGFANQNSTFQIGRYSDLDLRSRMGFLWSLNHSNSETDKKRHAMNSSKDGMYADKLQSLQNRNSNDKWKRHSMSFGYKGPETEAESKFKRYSMEVPDFTSRSRLTKRCSTLDVNHNQGVSKIPLRNGHFFGSRTAPATRASSPIRFESMLRFDQTKLDDISTTVDDDRMSPDQRLGIKFSSSDEEIDKLCHKFMQGQTTTMRGRESRLPIRTQRKKM